MTSQEETVNRFERAFNLIHRRLKELNHFPKSDHFLQLLHKSSKRNSVVRHYFHRLKQYARLRNAIVHEYVKEGEYIAAPNEEVVQEIESICDKLQHPPSALSLATSPVICFQPESLITTVLPYFDKQSVSQFPVYSGKEFKGLLTEGGIVKWINKHMMGNHLDLNAVQVKDVLEIEEPHNVEILPSGSTIFDLEEAFEAFFDKNQKLEAVLLTQDGVSTQKPIGIVTSWDLIRIDHTTLTLTSQS